MVTPTVKNFAAKPAGGIAVPNRHAEAALQSHPEEERRDVQVAGGRGGRKPSPGTGSTAGTKMEAAGLGEGRILDKGRDSVGFDFGRQGLLRRSVGLSVDASTGGDRSTEGALCGSKAASLVQVQGVKGGPDGGAETAASGDAFDMSSRSVLTGGSGADPA